MSSSSSQVLVLGAERVHVVDDLVPLVADEAVMLELHWPFHVALLCHRGPHIVRRPVDRPNRAGSARVRGRAATAAAGRTRRWLVVLQLDLEDRDDVLVGELQAGVTHTPQHVGRRLVVGHDHERGDHVLGVRAEAMPLFAR